MKKVSVENLSFAYDTKLILKDIDLEISAGDFVCILGQSGCGKSTLLRLLAGLEKPTTGKISVDDRLVTGAGLDRGVVFQDYGLFPWKTAGDNILLALKQKYPDKPKAELKAIAMEMLEKVGLDPEVFHKLPKELSGGMKQRCAIARAFGIDPPILLMDEPFGALDAVTRAKLQDMVLELWKKDAVRKTVFFVTHDVDEALLLANRIVVLGQSPRNVIYSCEIPDDKKPDRYTMFENPEIMALRNTLIRNINRNVAERIH